MRTGFAASLVPGLAALVLGCVSSPAFAFPDSTPSARVDAEIRPNFGYLLRPSLRRHHYDACRWGGRGCRGGRYHRDGYYNGGQGYYPPEGYPPTGYPPNGYPPGGGYPPQDSIRVDCSVAGGGGNPLAQALYTVPAGGVIYVKAGAACNETILIDHPVTIVGEGIPAFANGPNPQPAALAPPQGNPAFVVAQGVKGVEIRDMVIECREARDAACIEAYNADLALTRVVLRYQGNASALYASGGRLVVRESEITAQTFDPAVVADGVMAQISDSRISGESVGIDITLGGQSRSTISNVGVLGIQSTDPSDRPEFGIMVHGARESASGLDIQNATMWGWRTGLWVGRGADVTMVRSRVGRAAVGVASGGVLSVSQSLIGGYESGVYVFGGRSAVHGVVMHEFTRDPVVVEKGAILDDADIWVFPSACGPGFARPRWNCRLASQLPAAYHDDGDVRGPWGWSDESYRTIGGPPPPRHHGWFGRRSH